MRQQLARLQVLPVGGAACLSAIRYPIHYWSSPSREGGEPMTQNEQTNRMRWASRRGLLELDLLLGPFMDACFAELEPSLKDDYQQLMGHEDQDILNWILGRETLVDESLVAITDKIRAHNLSKLR